MPVPSDPLWYKDAIIYELRVRSFADSNADGIGDFAGLTGKLDYLEDLGITAIWLLPFYPSPGRDDGYDISDYTEVNLDYGRIEDFKEFLAAAHARGMRVLTELVINHTSDQHPWFQAARRAPAGSAQRDFYVWSDTPARYRDARIIFKDFETSNWSWDPLAKAYYWHRFFSHQPDLNFRSPEVQAAVFAVCDFWLELGVDGMRLDAIPYLYEEEGTNCENLPETHAFLKKLRSHIDEKFTDRMLLAEANQWPEDAAAYFGDGDECNMNFHFPIMPRIFMSIHMEDRLPIADILAQTPPIPDSAQWALFLRNHDELTLEMVTDEERDYMYRAFANDPTMRINLGIRRRLAPLLQNDRPNIELMNALLFSLPGTPVIYYGDELGMGDNVYLGDRNGVRTPMQWSSDRNAGFSKANPQRLMLPVIIDPEYHYESINVEAQQTNIHSLLWWTKRLVGLRKRTQVFGRGTMEVLHPENARVFAFLRRLGSETVLVVANLSRKVQFVELDLSAHQGLIPVEMFGGTRFPAIGAGPYLLTLGGHAFYWFSLERNEASAALAPEVDYQPPTLTFSAPLEVFAPAQRAGLEQALLGYLERRRWIGSAAETLERVKVTEVVPMGATLRWVGLSLRFRGDEESEAWAMLLAVRSVGAVDEVSRSRAVIARLSPASAGSEASERLLVEATGDVGLGGELLGLLRTPQRLPAPGGNVTVEMLAPPGPLPEQPLEPSLPKTPHETLAMTFGDQQVLKVQHRLASGTPPDYEITRFLTGRAPTPPTAPLLSALVYRPWRGEPQVMATLQAYAPHDKDGWQLALAELSRFYERVLTAPRELTPPPEPSDLLSDLQRQRELPSEVAELVGVFPQTSRLMGQRLADLHRALVSEPSEPAFEPEPYSSFDQRSLYQSLRNLAGEVLRRLRFDLSQIEPTLQPLGGQLLEATERLYAGFQPVLARKLTALRARIHGDLDLAHLLHNGKDFTFIDFDGDRRRPLSERRRKRSPLRDLAHLLTSVHRAAYVELSDQTAVRPADRPRVQPWAQVWFDQVGGGLLQQYREAARGARYLPENEEEFWLLARVFLLEEGLIELGQELEAPSTAMEAPLRLLLSLVGTSSPAALR